MYQQNRDHQHTGPDVDVTPGVPFEQDADTEIRIAPTLVAAYWKEQEVDLTLTEFWMVHALAKHPGHVKNRQQLMDAASVVLDDNTITSHIKRIRKKFLAIDKEFDSIQTVYGMGYRWHKSKSTS